MSELTEREAEQLRESGLGGWGPSGHSGPSGIGYGPATSGRFGGYVEGAQIIDGRVVGGTHYTREEWERKKDRERMAAIEAKLDRIIALLDPSAT